MGYNTINPSIATHYHGVGDNDGGWIPRIPLRSAVNVVSGIFIVSAGSTVTVKPNTGEIWVMLSWAGDDRSLDVYLTDGATDILVDDSDKGVRYVGDFIITENHYLKLVNTDTADHYFYYIGYKLENVTGTVEGILNNTVLFAPSGKKYLIITVLSSGSFGITDNVILVPVSPTNVDTATWRLIVTDTIGIRAGLSEYVYYFGVEL